MPEAHINTGVRTILNWNLFYSAYQSAIGDHRIYKRVVQSAPDLNNKFVVDIGSGNGRLLDFIPESCAYIGYDFNEKYISSASNKYRNRNAAFYLNDVNQTTFKERNVDVAFLIGVIHHLSDSDVMLLLKKIKNILKPTGILISLDPVLIENQNVIARYIIKNDRGTHVRNIKNYENLTKSEFINSKYTTFNNLLNIPFNHIIQISQND